MLCLANLLSVVVLHAGEPLRGIRLISLQGYENSEPEERSAEAEDSNPKEEEESEEEAEEECESEEERLSYGPDPCEPRKTLLQWSYGTSFSGGPDLEEPIVTDRPDFTE